MQEDRENDAPKTIRSVVRALSVLNVIGGDSKGISAISKELQLSKGTVFDLIKTLEFMRYVAQDPKDGSYRVGPALLKLAVRRFSENDLVEIARPYVQELADDLGEIVHLGQREGMFAAFLDRAVSRKVTRMLDLNSQVGALSPLHCTSMGKIFLTYMSDAEVLQFLDQHVLQAYTEKTITDRRELQEERRRIRQRGYALNIGEFEEGVSSLAVPIRNARGEVIAGLNTAVPSVRMPKESIPGIFAKLKNAAQQIEKELGA